MRTFFDTNILVYLFDESSPEKKVICQKLFKSEAMTGRAILSTQVLQEFYVTVTHKMAVPLAADIAEKAVRDLAKLPLINVDCPMIFAAIGRSRVLGFSFWDALIISAAISGGASVLYTEDLQHEQAIDGLKIVNPFLAHT
jgi:predicted nucleic acid-binding protein